VKEKGEGKTIERLSAAFVIGFSFAFLSLCLFPVGFRGTNEKEYALEKWRDKSTIRWGKRR